MKFRVSGRSNLVPLGTATLRADTAKAALDQVRITRELIGPAGAVLDLRCNGRQITEEELQAMAARGE